MDKSKSYIVFMN